MGEHEHLTEDLEGMHDHLGNLVKDPKLSKEQREKIEKQIARLKTMIDFMKIYIGGESPVGDEGHAREGEEAAIKSEERSFKLTKDGLQAVFKEMQKSDPNDLRTSAILIAIQNTNIKIDRQTNLMHDYFQGIASDHSWSKWENRIGAALASLLGIVAIVIAIAAWRKPVDPAQGGGGTSGSNSEADDRYAARLHARSSAADQKSVKETMEAIVIARMRVGAGVMDQESILKIFADYADETDIEDQDSALVMFGSTAVDLPETQRFFWQDPSHMMKRIDQLHRAYLAKRHIADVYREAQRLEYDGKPIPFFETASLLQSTLALVPRDNPLTADISVSSENHSPPPNSGDQPPA
jgi:hypothetical protein